MYCKFSLSCLIRHYTFVLIVAKCIVNAKIDKGMIDFEKVLIVAKCIVNYLAHH